MKARTCQRIWELAFAILFLTVNYASAFYDPHIGRWISRDPIGEDGGRNVYGFVDNNPIGGWDKMGLLKLQTVGNSPATTTDGTYAFAAVWFNFDSNDFNALGGKAPGGKASGTLVWSRSMSYSIRPCGAWSAGYNGSLNLWFRKEFQLNCYGGFTSGDLSGQDTTTFDNRTGDGLRLEVAGAALRTLVGESAGERLFKCGSMGKITAAVNWAVLPGILSGGDTTEAFWAGYDFKVAHAPQPLDNWNNWDSAIAQGNLRVDVEWNNCVNPRTKSITATSNWPITKGPDSAFKRPQIGINRLLKNSGLLHFV